ncbi:MAG: hypothetical protein SFV24_19215 [Gemmatimonadales bacterium]|nr:hypothetical protein [Gemmatimonadales bacterium]
MSRPLKRTCTTKVILDTLTRADDFMTAKQLREVTGEAAHRVSAALHHLKVVKAIDSMESDGVLWFYATPDADTRKVRLDDVKVEIRRPRKRKRAEELLITGSLPTATLRGPLNVQMQNLPRKENE